MTTHYSIATDLISQIKNDLETLITLRRNLLHQIGNRISIANRNIPIRIDCEANLSCGSIYYSDGEEWRYITGFNDVSSLLDAFDYCCNKIDL